MLAHTRRPDSACFPAPFLLGEPQSSRDIRRAEFVPLLSTSAPAPRPLDPPLGVSTAIARSSCSIVICCASASTSPTRASNLSSCGCRFQCKPREASGTQPLPTASVTTSPIPSSMLGSTRMSLFRSNSGTSLRWPSTFTLGCASIGPVSPGSRAGIRQR